MIIFYSSVFLTVRTTHTTLWKKNYFFYEFKTFSNIKQFQNCEFFVYSLFKNVKKMSLKFYLFFCYAKHIKLSKDLCYSSPNFQLKLKLNPFFSNHCVLNATSFRFKIISSKLIPKALNPTSLRYLHCKKGYRFQFKSP